MAGPSLEERRWRRFERALSLIALAVLVWSLVDWHGFNDFWTGDVGRRSTPIVLRVVAAGILAVDVVNFLRRRRARRAG